MTKQDQIIERLLGNATTIRQYINELAYHEDNEQLSLERLNEIEQDILVHVRNITQGFSELRKLKAK